MSRATLAGFLFYFSISGSAWADGSANAVAAEALFDQAKQLMAGGHYAEACPKLAESQRLDAGVGTLLNLADCYEHNGQTASAWEAFREVISAAHTAGQADREQIARDRSAAIEPVLSRVTIEVTTPIPGIEVKRDGVLVQKPLWGLAVPVDPGAHEIEAVAPGRKAWHASITVKNQPAQSITARVPALEAASVQTAARPSNTLRYVGLTAAGVGVAGVVVGAVFGARAISKNKASNDDCHDGNHCDEVGVDLRSQALTAANVSTAAFIAGGVLAAGGTALYLMAPRSSRAPAVGVSIGPGSLAIDGRF